MRKHWFFDFDGTLADTEADIKNAWREAIRSLSLDCPRFDELYRTGPTLDKMVYELFDNATPELVEQMRTAFGPCYDEGGFPLTHPYEGVENWMRLLKNAGCGIYVATNKRYKPTSRLMRKLEWDVLFDGFYSFDMYGDRLTKTQLLQKVMQDRGIAPSDAVMVGDTKGDVDAGSGAGMYTIACTWGYGSRAELEDADEIIERVPDSL